MSNQIPEPPRWADWLLERFCLGHLLEIIQGDLYELYHKRTIKKGNHYATFWYILDVVNICGRFALKRERSHSNILDMLYNYYKITIRNIMRHKAYSAIKIGGFALGIAICLLISLFIADELSYDRHYPDADRIYRLLYEWNEPGDVNRWPSFQGPSAKVIREEVPGIEKVGRIVPRKWFLAGSNLVRVAGTEQNLYESGFVYLDQEIFDIITPTFLEGDPATALKEPHSIVITETKAKKYFPEGGAVGKMILLNDDTDQPMKITGVIEDLPTNTHFNFSWAMTMAGVEFWPGEQNSWCCNNYHVYAKLKPEAKLEDVIAGLQRLKTNHILPYQEKRSSVAEIDNMKEYFGVSMQPITDIHLRSGSKMDRTYVHGDIKIVWMFAAIAVLIFVLASINFVNLSIAKSANRAKEVGLRKVVGSPKAMLVTQFLVESIVFSLISFILGLLIAALLIPSFNELTGKALSIPIVDWYFVPLIILIALCAGVAAGLYPAFFLSAFKPIEVIKGRLSRGAKSSALQSTLIIFQFTVSVVLIVGALVVNGQMDFILNKKLGYEKEQVVLLQGTNTLEEKIQNFKDELKNLASVQNVTISEYFPVSRTQRDQNQFWKEGMQKIEEPVGAQFWRVDDDYIATMGMEIVKGRNFSSTMASDSNAIVINETMVKEFGYEEPIGQRITNGYTRVVVGVVKDFHFDPMTAEIRSLAFAPGRRPQMMAVRIAPDNVKETLGSIGELWDVYQPNQPIRYQFLSDRYEQMYGHVKRTSEVFTIFAVLAIVIACLGLFALSTFMVEQRRKEISIRKILGASLRGLFRILTIDFLKLVAVAFIIAIPLGWYAMNYWLEGFEYKIGISWLQFAVAGGTIFIIAVATMSYEVLRAVNNNPADTLHAE